MILILIHTHAQWPTTAHLLNQSAPRKHNQERKTHKPLRTPWISQRICQPCLSCYFDYRINKSLAAGSASLALSTWSWRTRCAKDHGLKKILFTHKSTSSQNPIIWPLGVRYHKDWYKLHLSKYKLQSKLSNNSKRLGTNAFPGPVRDSATWDKLSGERYLSGYVWQFFFVLAGTGWT